jgi:hypothetical protein
MNSKTTAICAACGAAASSAVAVVALRMARAARRDAALAEAGLFEAQEAASVAAGSRRARRRRTDSREAPAEADGRSRQPPAPSLGLLGIGKLVFVARASAQLILAGYLVDELAHRGLPRGVYRQRARDFCRAAARSVKVTGATTLVVAAAASFKITLRALKALRTRDLPKSSLERTFAAAAEDIGAELHAWGNKMQNCDLMTHSEGEVGWLLREPGARRIVDQTAEFHRKLRELGDRRGGAKVRRKLLLDVFGSPKVSAARRGVEGFLFFSTVELPRRRSRADPRAGTPSACCSSRASGRSGTRSTGSTCGRRSTPAPSTTSSARATRTCRWRRTRRSSAGRETGATSHLGRFPLVSADVWTSDHPSERARSVDAGTRARGTPTLKRR